MMNSRLSHYNPQQQLGTLHKQFVQVEMEMRAMGLLSLDHLIKTHDTLSTIAQNVQAASSCGNSELGDWIRKFQTAVLELRHTISLECRFRRELNHSQNHFWKRFQGRLDEDDRIETNLGYVVMGVDLRTNKRVAMKFSFVENLARWDEGEKFSRNSNNDHFEEDPRRECVILRLLKQAGVMGVVPVVGEYVAMLDQKPCHVLVTEWCSKGNIYSAYCNSGKDENLLMHYFYQVLSIVNQLHQNGFCHLDISIENFVVTDDNAVFLIDFGRSRPLSRVPGWNEEITSRFVHWQFSKQYGFFAADPHRPPSKLPYMCPEAIYPEMSEMGQFDARAADMFAVGAMLLSVLLEEPAQQFPIPVLYDANITGQNHRHQMQTFNLPLQLCKALYRSIDKRLVRNRNEEVMDLLMRLLWRGDDKRFTAVQCLEHPLFNRNMPFDMFIAKNDPSIPDEVSDEEESDSDSDSDHDGVES